jgi:hypothetical protein
MRHGAQDKHWSKPAMTKIFSAKGLTEARNYAVGFADNLAEGETIDSFAVTKSVYAASVSDPDAAALILNGDPQLNEDPAVIDNVPQAAGQALIQNVSGGLVGQYVLTFSVTTSLGQIFVTDVVLPIAQYVP